MAVYSLDSTFVFIGIDAVDESGRSVSLVGDFNGDGFDDILIGAPGADPNGNNDAGETYLVFGTNTPLPHPFNLSSLNGTNGVQFNGIDTNDLSGVSIFSAGDFNGDGFDDILIGAYGADPNGNNDAGETYLIFGTNTPLPHPFNLSSLNGTNGVQFNGIDANDYSGSSVSSAGDFNGDGFDDILISARGAAPNGNSTAGETYLIFGTNTPLSPQFNLIDLNGTNGVIFNGIDPADYSGQSVSSVGDFNGDGFDDILIGAFQGDPNGNTSAGETYLIFGTNTTLLPQFNLSSINGINGIQFNGISPSDWSGYSVSSAGDFNGDGFNDILIGANGAAPNGINNAGETYLIFGTSSPLSHPFNLSSINGTTGVQFNGIDSNDQSGYSVSSAGDINGDGFDDILIGAYIAGPTGMSTSGETYLIFGSNLPLTSPFELSSLNNVNGMYFSGIFPGDRSGFSVSLASDFNGDGFDDILIGAYRASPNGNSAAGETYLILGTNISAHYRNLTTNLLVTCPPGSAGPGIALTSASCPLCLPGQYQPLSSSLSCIPCPSGSWSEISGATQCTLCTPGQYQPFPAQNSFSSCLDCPIGSYSPDHGSPSCYTCPSPQSQCPSPGSLRPLPSPGYQHVPGGPVDQFTPCTPPEACPGGALNTCSKGYANPSNLCSDCVPNYYRNKGKCVPCTGDNINYTALFAVLYIFFILALIPISAKGHKFGITSMFASLFQIISLFGYIQIDNAPQEWNSTFDVLSTALFSFEIAAPECSSKQANFFTTWYLQMFSPLFSIGVLLSFYPITLLLQHLLKPWALTRPSSKLSPFILHTKPKHFRAYFRSAAIFALSLLYTIVTKSALSILDCTTISPTLIVMQSYPALQCYSDEWVGPAVLSYLTLIFYTLGFPAFGYLYVYKHTKQGNLSETKQLVYGSFLDKYKPKYAYWECVSLLRKAALLVATFMFSNNIKYSFFLFFIVFFLSIYFQATYQPYWTRWLNNFESMIFIISMVIQVFAGIIAFGTNTISPFLISILNIILIIGSIIVGFYFAAKHKILFKEAAESESLVEKKITQTNDVIENPNLVELEQIVQDEMR